MNEHSRNKGVVECFRYDVSPECRIVTSYQVANWKEKGKEWRDCNDIISKIRQPSKKDVFKGCKLQKVQLRWMRLLHKWWKEVGDVCLWSHVQSRVHSPIIKNNKIRRWLRDRYASVTWSICQICHKIIVKCWREDISLDIMWISLTRSCYGPGSNIWIYLHIQLINYVADEDKLLSICRCHILLIFLYLWIAVWGVNILVRNLGV